MDCGFFPLKFGSMKSISSRQKRRNRTLVMNSREVSSLKFKLKYVLRQALDYHDLSVVGMALRFFLETARKLCEKGEWKGLTARLLGAMLLPCWFVYQISEDKWFVAIHYLVHLHFADCTQTKSSQIFPVLIRFLFVVNASSANFDNLLCNCLFAEIFACLFITLKNTFSLTCHRIL